MVRLSIAFAAVLGLVPLGATTPALSEVNESRDIVLVDQRGTGGSNGGRAGRSLRAALSAPPFVLR